VSAKGWIAVETMIVGLATEEARGRIAACADHMGVSRSVATAADVPELLEIHRRSPADLVVVDLAFTGSDPVVFAGAVRARSPFTEVVLTGPISPFTASRAMASGTRALVCGPGAETDQLTASVARSIILTFPGAVRAAAAMPRRHPGSRPDRLTPREVQVLRAMSDGKSNAQIATELFLSVDTVKCHAKRLFRKLGVHDRAHAVAEAFRSRLIC
jgi:DNA-binding NarL/FixJ family response regulator